MKTALAFCCLFAVSGPLLGAEEKPIPNRLIDYKAFLKGAGEVARLRAERRVSEDEFIRMAGEQGTVVFDARSANLRPVRDPVATLVNRADGRDVAAVVREGRVVHGRLPTSHGGR